MTRSPFLWTFSPTQPVRKTGFSSLLFPAADGPRGAPRGPSSPPTSHALYRYPYAFSQFRDCPVTIDSHPSRLGKPSRPPAALSDAPARQGPPQAQARRAKRLFLPCAPRQLLVQWEPPKTSMPSTFRQFCSSGLCGQVWGSPVDGLWITAGRWITDFHNPHSGTKGVIVPAARGLPVSDRGKTAAPRRHAPA